MATRTSIINSAGTIQFTLGDAKIIGIDGVVRAAHLGDKVFPREMIMTSANAAVHMQLEDGRLLDIDQEAEGTLTADVTGAANVMLAQAGKPSAPEMQAAIPTGKVVGTITIVAGNVKIIGDDGVERVAKVGDKLLASESLTTGGDGIVQVQLVNGKLIDLGWDSKLALSDEIIAEAGGTVPGVAEAPTAAVPAGAEQDAAAIQKLIAAGADPTQVAAATAAGGAPVVIDQSNSTGDVTSGFPTQPAGITFPEIEPELLTDGEPGPRGIDVRPNDGPFASSADGDVYESGLVPEGSQTLPNDRSDSGEKYNTLAEGTDEITDFTTGTPASGGDTLDISAVLNLPGSKWTGGTLQDAVDDGYLQFVNDGSGKVQVNVDIDPSGGAGPTPVAVLSNVAFVDAATAIGLLSDNIKLD